MFGNSFYYSLIRKYVTIIGSLFDNINIIRLDENGKETANIIIPVTYSSKDKMLARVLADPNISRQSETITLPVIAFEISDYKYDSSRKLITVDKTAYKEDSSNFIYQYSPVPYNIGLTYH